MKNKSASHQLIRRAKKWARRYASSLLTQKTSGLFGLGTIVAIVASFVIGLAGGLNASNPLPFIAGVAATLAALITVLGKWDVRVLLGSKLKELFPNTIAMTQAYLRQVVAEAKTEALGENSKLNLLLADAEKRRDEAGVTLDKLEKHLKTPHLDSDLEKELLAAQSVAEDALQTFREAVEKLTKHRTRLDEFFARAEAMLQASSETPYAAVQEAYRLAASAREMEISVEEVIADSLSRILARVNTVQAGLVEMHRAAGLATLDHMPALGNAEGEVVVMARVIEMCDHQAEELDKALEGLIKEEVAS